MACWIKWRTFSWRFWGDVLTWGGAGRSWLQEGRCPAQSGGTPVLAISQFIALELTCSLHPSRERAQSRTQARKEQQLACLVGPALREGGHPWPQLWAGRQVPYLCGLTCPSLAEVEARMFRDLPKPALVGGLAAGRGRVQSQDGPPGYPRCLTTTALQADGPETAAGYPAGLHCRLRICGRPRVLRGVGAAPAEPCGRLEAPGTTQPIPAPRGGRFPALLDRSPIAPGRRTGGWYLLQVPSDCASPRPWTPGTGPPGPSQEAWRRAEVGSMLDMEW